ncbi:MAG: UDP-N-acetylenolpyruvoylglucosamine reductase, partial [Planctomycetota bacterium]
TIERVDTIRRDTGAPERFSAAGCRFDYRDSRFKRDGSHIITHVTFALRPDGTPETGYAGLAARLPARPDLAQVRAAVIAVRREKSMVPAAMAERTDPNRFSAGSWFTNPIVDTATADRIASLVATSMPRWPAGNGRVKLAAAWLIEQAGFPRGFGEGPARVSTQHTLALVNTGCARTTDMLELEARIRDGVSSAFGVWLVREPVWLAA